MGGADAYKALRQACSQTLGALACAPVLCYQALGCEGQEDTRPFHSLRAQQVGCHLMLGARMRLSLPSRQCSSNCVTPGRPGQVEPTGCEGPVQQAKARMQRKTSGRQRGLPCALLGLALIGSAFAQAPGIGNFCQYPGYSATPHSNSLPCRGGGTTCTVSAWGSTSSSPAIRHRGLPLLAMMLTVQKVATYDACSMAWGLVPWPGAHFSSCPDVHHRAGKSHYI